MTERSVTIYTADHGPVTIPEPAWCTAPHRDGGYREDITHAGPDVDLTTDTGDGPAVLLSFALEQHPFQDDAGPGGGVFVSVWLADGEYHPHDVDGLERLAVDLAEAGRGVRLMARRLAAETGQRPRPQQPGEVLAAMAQRLAEQAAAGRAPWADITADSGERHVTTQQAVGPYVVRLTATITAQEVTE
ncbi:DUF6907 domain-containing protein [Streptomyces sp. NPDC059373]